MTLTGPDSTPSTSRPAAEEDREEAADEIVFLDKVDGSLLGEDAEEDELVNRGGMMEESSSMTRR